VRSVEVGVTEVVVAIVVKKPGSNAQPKGAGQGVYPVMASNPVPANRAYFRKRSFGSTSLLGGRLIQRKGRLIV